MRRYGLMWLGLALTALSRLDTAASRPDDALAGGLDRPVVAEHFALRRSTPPDPDRTASSRGAPRDSYVGACTWTRATEDGTTTLQLDLELPLEDTRVLQVEEIGADGRSFVWRELRAGGGRTIRFTSGPERTEAVEWSVTGTKRRVDWPSGGALGWLELAELARADRAPASALWIDPLARELVRVRIHVERGPGERLYVVRSHAGHVVAELRFAGDEWVSFAWQSDGLVAEPVSADAHERFLADGDREERPDARTE